MEDFPHIHLTRAPSSWTRLDRRDRRCCDDLWLVRPIRWILLARTVFLKQNGALLG